MSSSNENVVNSLNISLTGMNSATLYQYKGKSLFGTWGWWVGMSGGEPDYNICIRFVPSASYSSITFRLNGSKAWVLAYGTPTYYKVTDTNVHPGIGEYGGGTSFIWSSRAISITLNDRIFSANKEYYLWISQTSGNRNLNCEMWKEDITVTNTVTYTGQTVGNEQTLWINPNGGEVVQYSFDPNSQWLIRDDYILASNTGVSVVQSAYTWSIAANYTYVMEYTSRCNGSAYFSIDCYNYGYNSSDPGSVEGPQPPDPLAPQGAYRHSWAFLNSTTKNYYIRLFTDTTNKPNIQFSKLRFHRIEGISSAMTYKKCEAGVNVGKLPGSSGFMLGAPTRAGYKFLGWYTDSGVYVDENYIMPNSDLIINARWQPIYSLDVNSRVNGQDWGDTGDLAIFDVYINGNLIAQNVNDYYDNVNWPEGTQYEIANIRVTNTYDWKYDGTVSNNISGVLTSNTDVRLILNQVAYLDVNGYVNETNTGGLGPYATCEVWVNGTKIAGPVEDFYQQVYIGSNYEIKNYVIKSEYAYDWGLVGLNTGSNSSPLTGTVNANPTNINFDIRSIYRVFYNSNGGNALSVTEQQCYYNEGLILTYDTPTRNDGIANGYTVQFYLNDGTANIINKTSLDTYSYNFKNWNTNNNGSGTPYNPGDVYVTNASMTLYAQWNPILKTRGTITLPTANEMVRKNYELLGFSTNQYATSADSGLTPGASYTPNADNIILYAIWKLKGSIIYINNEPYNVYIKDSDLGYNLYQVLIKESAGWAEYNGE